MSILTIHFTRNLEGRVFSKALQWYEGIPISHVAVELPTSRGLGQNFIIHSVIGTGVSLLSKSKFLKDNEIMESYSLTLELEEYKAIRNAMLSDCGEKYGLMQNIGILIVDLLRKINIMSTNPFKHGQNCSELIYRHVIPGEFKPKDLVPDLVKPSHIRRILLQNGYLPTFTKIP